ncbi:MAG: tRNA-(ms[2]io[6]A)-hydroxylase [Proteobacteria bacterium]|nr:tRNA-(ms[2]io[6]A)-hydroxylase [Pseudomonadota bacterium]
MIRAWPTASEFLYCRTPDAWLDRACSDVATLLIDHANAEKKAAGTALSLLYRYVDHDQLLLKLSRLAREELRHFEQLVVILRKRGIAYVHVPPGRYAGALRKGASTSEPRRLVDVLLISAIVEARSCERFEALTGVLDAELADFYAKLMDSEARHFVGYLDLAHHYGDADYISQRLAELLKREGDLILSTDPEFRFHSGVPQTAKAL